MEVTSKLLGISYQQLNVNLFVDPASGDYELFFLYRKYKDCGREVLQIRSSVKNTTNFFSASKFLVHFKTNNPLKNSGLFN